MGDNDRTAHKQMLNETGRFKLNKEQEDTIRMYLENTDLSLEEESESTLELPQLRKL